MCIRCKVLENTRIWKFSSRQYVLNPCKRTIGDKEEMHEKATDKLSKKLRSRSDTPR